MQTNQPSFFLQGPKPVTQLAIFVLLSLALIVGDAQLHVLGRLRQQLSVVLYPLQWLATAPFSMVKDASYFFTKQAELIKENKALNDAKLAASLQTMQIAQLKAENAQLSELLEARRDLPRPSQLAEILYNGRDPFSARLIINKGAREGIREGSIVTDASGLIGQIVRVQPFTSEIRLLSDHDHMAPVVVERNQLRTVVYGMGKRQPLEVRNMAPNVDIQVGDRMVTSGIDGIYPAGIPVARVTHVDRRGAFARIICAALGALEQHRFVIVLDESSAALPYPDKASATASVTAPASKGK